MTNENKHLKTFFLDEDVIAEISKIPKSQKSKTINEILRAGLKLKPSNDSEQEQSKRWESMQKILKYIKEKNYCLQSDVLGYFSPFRTKEKLKDYLQTLEQSGAIVRINNYLIDYDYYHRLQSENKPLPGSEKWIQERG